MAQGYKSPIAGTISVVMSTSLRFGDSSDFLLRLQLSELPSIEAYHEREDAAVVGPGVQ